MFRLFRKKNLSETEPKVFTPPRNVREHLEILLRLCSFQFCSELRIYLYTEDKEDHKTGDVVLIYEERIHEMTFLVRSGVPELYDYLYCHPGFNLPEDSDSSHYLKLCFHEPDCFLFSCSKEELEKLLKSISGRAYIWKFWRISCPNRIRITCDELEHDMQMYRLEKFEKYVRKHFYTSF